MHPFPLLRAKASHPSYWFLAAGSIRIIFVSCKHPQALFSTVCLLQSPDSISRRVPPRYIPEDKHCLHALYIRKIILITGLCEILRLISCQKSYTGLSLGYHFFFAAGPDCKVCCHASLFLLPAINRIAGTVDAVRLLSIEVRLYASDLILNAVIVHIPEPYKCKVRIQLSPSNIASGPVSARAEEEGEILVNHIDQRRYRPVVIAASSYLHWESSRRLQIRSDNTGTNLPGRQRINSVRKSRSSAPLPLPQVVITHVIG